MPIKMTVLGVALGVLLVPLGCSIQDQRGAQLHVLTREDQRQAGPGGAASKEMLAALREASHIARLNSDDLFTRHHLASIALAQSQLGDVAGALDTLESIPDKDLCSEDVLLATAKNLIRRDKRRGLHVAKWLRPWAKVELYLAMVSPGDSVTGKPEAEALEMIRTAREIARTMRGYNAVKAHVQIGVTLHQLDNREEARLLLKHSLRLAKGIDDSFDRIVAYKEAALGFAEVQDKATAVKLLQEAIKVANWVDRRNQGNAFLQIAAAQAALGLDKEAVRTAKRIRAAKRISADFVRPEAFKHIALAQIRRGKFEMAINTSKMISWKTIRDRALMSLSAPQSVAGDFDGALRTTESIKDVERKAQAIVAVAACQAKQGDAKGARRTGEVANALKIELSSSASGKQWFRYNDPSTWGRTARIPGFTLASAYVHSEMDADLAAASMGLLAELGEDGKYAFDSLLRDKRAILIRRVAREQARHGRAKNAFQWANRIQDPLQRVEALLGIAEGMSMRSTRQRVSTTAPATLKAKD